MPLKPIINTFSGGLDKDTAPEATKNNSYRDAHHVQLTGDGKFASLQNLRGTSYIAEILGSVTYATANVMGAFKVKTYIETSAVTEECVYIFLSQNISSVYHFKIFIFRPSTSTITLIYDKSRTAAESGAVYMVNSVDALSIGEAGVDTIYFTNNLDAPGRIRCILETAPTITERQTELWRRYPQNSPVIDSIVYNPKSQGSGSTSHVLTLSQTYDNDADGLGQRRTGNFPLTPEMAVSNGDAFQFDVFCRAEVLMDGGFTTSIITQTVKIWDEPFNGSGVTAGAAIYTLQYQQIGSGGGANTGTFQVSVDISGVNKWIGYTSTDYAIDYNSTQWFGWEMYSNAVNNDGDPTGSAGGRVTLDSVNAAAAQTSSDSYAMGTPNTNTKNTTF